MTTAEIIAAATELHELQRLREDLESEITAIQDAIKSHMSASGEDQITAGPFKITWKAVTSNRIDTAALKRDLPEVWQEYGKTTTSRRFCVQ